MRIVEQAKPRVYSLREIVELFAIGEAVVGFGLSDRGGFQDRFIEVQVWEHFSVLAPGFRIGPR
jgi:hypothetical protein